MSRTIITCFFVQSSPCVLRLGLGVVSGRLLRLVVRWACGY